MPKANASWPYPGKVLIVDDEYDEPIKLAVEQLLQNGVPVGYWNSKNPKTVLSNTRIVLLDLILRPEDADRSGPEKFDRAIKAISHIRGASIVIIFSSAPDEPSDFEEAYSHKKGKYPGVISERKMNKSNLNNPKELITLIENSVKDHPEVRLALLLESIVDSAKDGAFESTLGQNVDVVAALIKIMVTQTGKEGLRKELIDTMIRILSRHAHSGKAYEALPEVLEQMLTRAYDLEKLRGSLLSSLMYYQPREEQVWTGDIFRTRKKDGRQIAIVLTPACDLAWGSPTSVTVSLGFSLTASDIENRKSILFQKDESLRKLALNEEQAPNEQTRTQVSESINKRIESYRITGKNLPAWAYTLHHVNDGGNLVDVCLDLDDIERVPIKKLKTGKGHWRRITRLDSPFVEALLQEFGRHHSRIGVPDINLSLEAFAERATKHR